MQDLTHELLLDIAKQYKSRPIIIEDDTPEKMWLSQMAFVPLNKWFKTKVKQHKSIQSRLNFLHVLEKTAKLSGLFVVTDEFSRDFVYRND